MRLVKPIDPTAGQDKANDAYSGYTCEVGQIKKCGNPVVAVVNFYNGSKTRICAECAAGLIGQLAPILGAWAADGTHDKVGRWAPYP